MLHKVKSALLVLLISISVSSADYVNDLEDTVIKQEELIRIKDQKIIELQTHKDEQYIFRVWFTDWGVTKDHVVGGTVVFFVMII